jgi:MFS family permease
MAEPLVVKQELASTRWMALASASVGWMFDAMDLQLFTLILFPCVSELIATHDQGQVAWIAGLIMACKLAAWGLDGIVFGVVADRIGRSRTMVVTISPRLCPFAA